MTIYSYFIGTRVDQGKFGPQSQDMSLSDLVGLLRPDTGTIPYVYPDLTPLVLHVNEQIQAAFDERFAQLHERERMQNYNSLFNAWSRAATYEDNERRGRMWENVVDKAEAFLQALQPAFPQRKPEKDWNHDSHQPIIYAGRMYTEALLFIITARAAVEPQTLYRDVSLRGYCDWLRCWVKAYLSEEDRTRLLLDASLRQQERYLAVRVLGPDAIPALPDTFLADHVRKRASTHIDRADYLDDFERPFDTWAKAAYRELFALEYADFHWQMVYTLRDVLYRAERLEAFITDLEEKGNSVAFDQQRNTTETVQALLRGDDSQPPMLPEEKENSGC
ncbi:hypothetical protein PSR30_04440 [Pectobacterium carotovorum subsp. carotovorum]|uniref:hypothetical protein n=1 Tax=Pectobacterium carotovorum TaxID=554 RepID=UPI00236732DA|nr:hypothetical protein [Pectobacterium carotovorum]WDF99824.1 hypothetical protein PSR30_04440 [Pectobacterium carotovorum subsp. carotovorum]